MGDLFLDREPCPGGGLGLGVVGMRAEWEPDELIGSWTLVEGDWKLIRNTGAKLAVPEYGRNGPQY
ncbi:hypothetical protein OHA25_37515 [Nonomuraea sp. NBC_00507]|uniref:hypothetical protein n=1 Tax=Nonomuraea sp. NBC_00507 TaxID=2976002 RepID=UPI002E198A53